MTSFKKIRTKVEEKSNARIYWVKAQRFAHAAQTNSEQGDWDPAVANAVNAIINIVDAICVHYQGERSAGESHFEALELLGRVERMDAKLRDALRKHLGAVLEMKSLAQYDGRLCEERDAVVAIKHLERATDAVVPVAKANRWQG